MKEKPSILHVNKEETFHASMVGFLIGSGVYFINSPHLLLKTSCSIGIIYGLYNIKVGIEHIIKRLEEK